MGTLNLRLAIRGSRSLKDKRGTLNSLKDRLTNQYNVSVAEVDAQDLLQVAELGVVQAGADARYVRGSLERLVQQVRSFRGAQLTDYSIEIFHC